MKKSEKKSSHFSYEERIKIETLSGEGFGIRQIARKLSRSESSVSDEISQNKVKGEYIAKKAHQKARQRRRMAKYQAFKVVRNWNLEKYVKEKISCFWSPEAISGRLRNIDTHLPYAGKDAIYAYVKSVYGRNIEQFLWYKGKKPKSKIPRVDILNRNFIEKRPKSVEKRRVFGDWEADFIVSGKQGKGALLVFAERKSRYVLLFKLENRKVVTINSVLQKIVGVNLVVNSLTIDNDVCFRHHEEMSRILKAPIFFCHPYHSWEKGSVEKMNQLIRRFIPKKSDISQIEEKKILWIQNILNQRPMKCLEFYTPAEIVARDTKLNTLIGDIFAKKSKLTLLAKCSD